MANNPHIQDDDTNMQDTDDLSREENTQMYGGDIDVGSATGE